MRISPALSRCPHCGFPEFYVRLAVRGTITERYRFDGAPADNTGMWDSVASISQRKTVYCGGCDRRIATAS